MKILHVVPGLNEGGNGIAVAAKLIAREQSKSGAEVEVVETRDFVHSNIRTIRTIEQFSEVWVHSMWLPMTLKACWKVLRNVRMFECSECSNVRPKLVRMTHANLDPLRYRYHGWKKRLVAPIERWLFRRTDRVVVTCEAEKKWCQEWGLKNEFEVVNLKKFFDLNGGEGLGRRSRSTVEDSLHVLYLGRRHPLKGVEFLERAVREIGLGRRSRSTVEGKFVIVAGTDAPFRKTKDALAWARATGLIGRMRAEETGGKGIVMISAESIRETLNPRQREKSASDKVHFSALTKLRELIRESKILEVHPDWLKDSSGHRTPLAGENSSISICIAYAAFRFEESLYRVRLTLKRYAQTGASKAYAYRVNEIEVVPGTLGGKIAPATYPTDTTSICGSILLQGVVDVNGRLGESKSEHSNNRTIGLRIVSDHFGEELERDWEWCDVLVLPTLSENFGLVVAEALERGKRVITTDGAPVWGEGELFECSECSNVRMGYGGRLVYLKGYRDGTDEERVRMLKEALEKVSGVKFQVG